MIIQRCKKVMQKKNMRRGSVTIEFVFLVPLFLFMMIVVWQVAVAGMAVIQTQSALQDAMRVVSVTGDENEAVQEGHNTFGSKKNYKLSEFTVTKAGNEAFGSATTKIEVLFIPNQTITYNDHSKVAIVHD